MPGRQNTGPASQKRSWSKNKSQKRNLNALAIAESEDPEVKIRKSRFGHIVEDHEGTNLKSLDDELLHTGEEHAPSKRRRIEERGLSEDVESGSDGEGNDWIAGGVLSSDDSSLNSDEAFGPSDEERYASFTFRGSKSNRKGSRDTGPGPSVLDESNGSAFNSGDNSDAADDESDDFAANAVDLADVLDGSDSDRANGIESHARSSMPGSFSAFEGEESFDDDQGSQLHYSDVEDDVADTSKAAALKDFATALYSQNANEDSDQARFDAAQEAKTPTDFGITSREKLTAAELLPSFKDPKYRKALRMMAEDRPRRGATGKGVPKKLSVPLPSRQQGRLDRAAAYKESKDTLKRWVDTVKHNRQADHLVFPLQDPNVVAAKESRVLQPTSQSKPVTELENKIQSLLAESGLSGTPGRSADEEIQAFEQLAVNAMPVQDVRARRAELRRRRELLFREEIKAKRIKKIKSKSYRRVHRKEREKLAQKERDLALANGEEPDEDEQERMDRQRAEERMGSKHRNSRWAKGVKGLGRAAWDEEARLGVTEMARKEEELRRRIQGKDIGGENSLSSSESSTDELSDEEDDGKWSEKAKVKLSKLESNKDDPAASKLSSMKFIQKAEAAQRARNSEAIKELRRELGDDETQSESSEGEEYMPGRRSYGPKELQRQEKADEKKPAPRNEFEAPDSSEDEGRPVARSHDGDDVELVTEGKTGPIQRKHQPTKQSPQNARKTDSVPVGLSGNPWLVKPKHSRSRREVEEDVFITNFPFSKPEMQRDNPFMQPVNDSSTSSKTGAISVENSALRDQPAANAATNIASDRDDSSSFNGLSSRSASPEPAIKPPMSNQDLINKAFAADDILAREDFETEKAAMTKDEAPPSPTSSTGMPGWGSWVGAGLSKRDKRTGVAKSASKPDSSVMKNGPKSADEGVIASRRKDANLQEVIISEKRVPKTAKYLATQLPHPFETRAQYERSLRLPIGPEFTTSATFQNMTKPRILRTGGALPITPMRKPLK